MKRKKKINNQHSKQEQRARFNTFKRQVQYYLRLIGCEEVAGMFDKAMLTAMFKLSASQLPKLKVARGVTVDAETRKNIFSDFKFMITQKNIRVSEQLTVSSKEVFQYLAVIDTAVNSKIEKEEIKDFWLINKYLEKVPDFDYVYEKAAEDIKSIMLVLGVQMSRMNTSLCWLEHIERQPGDKYKRYTIEIREHIPKKQMMIIDHHPRPVYPLCYAIINNGPYEIAIPSDKIKLPGVSHKRKIPVYFQNHLLHRLDERLDCILPHHNQFYLFLSLLNPIFTYFMGKILVEFKVNSKVKLGYVVLDFHNDRLLAKTFLLLSNSGTPEGEKLKEISGMKKNDLSYWAIDKLSTFHKSDLKDHPHTRAMFEKAGGGDLFKDISALDTNDSSTTTSQAQQMLRYLEGV